jgi:hypothetical protein
MEFEPVKRLRQEQARRAQAERDEVLKTFRDATSEAYERAEEKQAELEQIVSKHSEWLERNGPRLSALLPRIPSALADWESLRNQYRAQFFSAIRDRDQVTANQLWGTRGDGLRDRTVLANEINRVNQQLGRCSGLSGALDRHFFKIETELISLEKRGLGLPPEPAPVAAKAPKTAKGVKVDTKSYDVRR